MLKRIVQIAILCLSIGAFAVGHYTDKQADALQRSQPAVTYDDFLSGAVTAEEYVDAAGRRAVEANRIAGKRMVLSRDADRWYGWAAGLFALFVFLFIPFRALRDGYRATAVAFERKAGKANAGIANAAKTDQTRHERHAVSGRGRSKREEPDDECQ